MRTLAILLFTSVVILPFTSGNVSAQIDAVIPYTSTPPEIDGWGTEVDPVWADVPGHGVDEFNTVVGAPPEDEADLSPTWKALWDENFLYVLVEVVDVTVFNRGECNWDDDGIEIYIDAQDLDSEDYQFDMNAPDGIPAYQFTAIAGDQAGGPYCADPPTENPVSAFTKGINSYDDGGNPENTRYPNDRIGEGDISNGQQPGDVFYSFEVAFSWDALEETPEDIIERGSFGFGVAVNDDDTNGSRETQMMWASESPDLWMRSDMFPSVALSTPPNGCDFDGNDLCNVDDIDALTTEGEAGTNDAMFDLTDDGLVNDADVGEWLRLAGLENGLDGPYLRGDTNLDRIVNDVDLNSIGIAWNQEDVAAWSAGNVVVSDNEPGVNPADLNGLAVNWQQEAPLAGAAANAVPEPSAHCVLFAVLMWIAAICRRRS